MAVVAEKSSNMTQQLLPIRFQEHLQVKKIFKLVFTPLSFSKLFVWVFFNEKHYQVLWYVYIQSFIWIYFIFQNFVIILPVAFDSCKVKLVGAFGIRRSLFLDYFVSEIDKINTKRMLFHLNYVFCFHTFSWKDITRINVIVKCNLFMGHWRIHPT